MEKEFVTYEQALALKELGFDERCFSRYYESGKLADSLSYLHHNYFGQVNAPLKQQVFRWFREKYNLNGFVFNYSKVWKWKIDLIGISCEDYSKEIDFIYTYEEAESACLDKLIEICKNK
jgi:hypothetical protein